MSNQYFKVSRGMVFWFDPSKAYGEPTEYTMPSGKKCATHLNWKERPWIVVSNNRGNSTSSICTIAPITSENKGHRPHHVEYMHKGRHQTILLEQLRTVDSDALGEYFYTVSDSILRSIERAIAYQFDIRPSISTTDFALDTTLKNLEQIISSIIQEKVKEYTSTVQVKPAVIPDSQIEDTALRLGHMVEKACDKSLKPNITVEVNQENKPVEVIEPEFESKQEVQEIKSHKSERLSQVDKFNQRLQKTHQITGKPVHNHSVPEPVNQVEPKENKPVQIIKKKRNTWTPEKRLQYLDDCEKLTPKEVMDKWNLGSIPSVFQTKYACKNALNK